ncbi:hypothetical protein CL614_09995 [archaeon]|nr:hypothetical protein [archaeon]|tara:strand:+ start:1937 stop:2866 length:930 start_codon:yes stop_codon:yes gene_type:complete
MLVSSCPLRISLLGGSTDLEDFIEENNSGQVISFPVNLYTYVAINERHDDIFLIQYAKEESVSNISEIKNDVVKVVLEYFNVNSPLTITLTADIPSHGSGLAASSSFMISMIKVISSYKGLNLGDMEICNLALKLERQFNPLVGRQDTVGCGIKGFKHLFFNKKSNLSRIKLYNHSYFENFSFQLISAGQGRKSTDVLKSLQLDKRICLYEDVDAGDKSIQAGNYDELNSLILETWIKKKETSSLIVNSDVLKIEEKIKSLMNSGVVSYKLCGAGNGGYMLVVKQKDSSFDLPGINVNIDNRGLSLWNL